jgi:beta-lactamase class A
LNPTSERIEALLRQLDCDYAFYYRRRPGPPLLYSTAERFPSASIIKLPILFAWLHLERMGEVDRAELCNLDAEDQVEGAGLSWLLRARRLPYQDVILLMLALSDNLCTNLVIRRIGIERLGALFAGPLGLPNTRLERRLMDYAARAAGLDNWVAAADCIRLFDLRDALSAPERAWVDSMLRANVDDGLLMRNIPRDTVVFHHKTGSITGVLHDWGYTDEADLFLLTRNVRDETSVYALLDDLGPLLLQPG